MIFDDYKRTTHRMERRAEWIVDLVWVAAMVFVGVTIALCIGIMIFADINAQDVDAMGSRIHDLLY